MDAVIPIVFPDYLIAVNTPPIKIKIPDVLPWIDVMPDHYAVAATKNKVPELGHAGVLLIEGKTGVTRYYEYGRYDPAGLGLTRSVRVSNVGIDKEGRPTMATLKQVLREISTKAGHGGRISGVYVETPGKFPDMEKYARSRLSDNKNPKRVPYNLTSNSCITFAKEVAEAGGVATPWMLDPRPNSYIGEFQADFPDVQYNPKDGKVIVEGWKQPS
jgi:hypothetical protein